MVSQPSHKKPRELPDHLLHHVIMPHLPVKTLHRWKCVSKEICSLITNDAQFAAEQARLADTSSTSFVSLTRKGRLLFFPDPESVGVPDLSLNFLNLSQRVKLISSTNGLLLLLLLSGYFHDTKPRTLCLCNPATREKVIINGNKKLGKFWSEWGLAYDPCKSPNQYKIVDPVRNFYHKRGDFFMFEVFHSVTGKWTLSSQSVYVPNMPSPRKAVWAKGVLYWQCENYLMWYNTERELAGLTKLPVINVSVIEKRFIHIGEYAGEITCCRTYEDGIEVWRLTHEFRWDMLHAASWDMLMDACSFWPAMHLRNKSRSDLFFKRRVVRPLGYDGRFVYIAVNRKRCCDNTGKLFGWEPKTSRVEERGSININSYRISDDVFSYVNSMARVPQTFNGAN